MTNTTRKNSPAMPRFAVIALVVGLAALTIALTLAPSHFWTENAAITVDFDDVVTDEEVDGAAEEDPRPALRVAVGAMVGLGRGFDSR